MPIIHLVPLLISLVLGTPATPAAAPAQSDTCEVDAYVTDPDPRGLNVRARPSTGARVLARIPADAEVKIIGASGRWLRIAQATQVTDEGEETTLFHGPGWVFADRLGTGSASVAPSPLRAEPRAGARVLRRLPVDTPVTLAGCRGSWARVNAGGTVGWLAADSRCANQRTTCS
jgi:SH3-like domain-containing protein